MEANPEVLAPFIATNGEFVSGATIARNLGLSRVSIHKHLEALRKDGFVFEATSNRGYRLLQEPTTFNKVLFKALLLNHPVPFFASVLPFKQVTSTNDLAEKELASERPAPFLIIATEQTQGRGRRGRVWHSPPNRNLYMSAAIRPSLPPARLQTITIWTGLRLCEWLRNAYGLPVMVKWPNDIMLSGRKLAGILTEARIDAEMTRDLTLGIGLNVNAGSDDFAPELQSIATSISKHINESLNLSRLAHQMAGVLGNALQDFLEPDTPDITGLWDSFDYLKDQPISADGLNGTACGITATGSLRLRRSDGSMALLHAGEVSLSKPS